MNIVQQILYLNKSYKILFAEQEFIVHPAAFGYLPISTASAQCSFTSSFYLEDYHLILNNLIVGNGENINMGGARIEAYEAQHTFKNFPIAYNGAILIGADIVKEYYDKDNRLSCFSYKSVYELIFEGGVLVTTIDQSKAMLRIRKNLELGLRSLSKGRDVWCIKRFVASSFVGDYATFRWNRKRINYLKDMKKDYPESVLLKLTNRSE